MSLQIQSSDPVILPYRQVLIESLSKDEAWGTEILDWTLPNERVSGWGLPSHGDSKDSCGTFFMLGCLNVSDHPDGLAVFKPMVKRCFDPKCPVDWKAWVLREAERISDRIDSAMKQKPWLGKPIHFVVSIPKKDWHLSKDEMCRRAYASSRRTGFLGGSVIYHPFRESIDGRWYFSPHLHFIGFGFISGEKCAKEYAKSGWIYHNEGVRKTVFGTAYYQLTHCGVWYGAGKKHSVTWFGELSYNKLKIVRDALDQVLCPYCGDPMEILVWTDKSDSPLPCSGIGGFYLASYDGWSSLKDLRLIASIPRDMILTHGDANSMIFNTF